MKTAEQIGLTRKWVLADPINFIFSFCVALQIYFYFVNFLGNGVWILIKVIMCI